MKVALPCRGECPSRLLLLMRVIGGHPALKIFKVEDRRWEERKRDNGWWGMKDWGEWDGLHGERSRERGRGGQAQGRAVAKRGMNERTGEGATGKEGMTQTDRTSFRRGAIGERTSGGNRTPASLAEEMRRRTVLGRPSRQWSLVSSLQ